MQIYVPNCQQDVNKNEIIVSGNHTPLTFFPTVNFYVFLDNCFKLQKQVTTIVKTRVYQLHQTAKARSDPPPKELEKCGILQFSVF